MIKIKFNLQNQTELKSFLADEKQYVTKMFIYGVQHDFAMAEEMLEEIKSSKDIVELKLDLKNQSIQRILDFFKPCLLSNSRQVASLSLEIYCILAQRKNKVLTDLISGWFQDEGQGLLVLLNVVYKQAALARQVLDLILLIADGDVLRFLQTHAQKIQNRNFNYFIFVQRMLPSLLSIGAVQEQI